jgi:hypothetical protein
MTLNSVDHLMIVGHFPLYFAYLFSIGIAGENNDRSRKIGGLSAPLFSQTSLTHHLEKQIENRRIRLFDLIKQNEPFRIR